MKANSKKLLSLLMAVAMVLSMAPVIVPQAEAAETFDQNTICEHCHGVPEGGWQELTARAANLSGHYYLGDDISYADGKYMTIIAAGAECHLHLNDHSYTSTFTGGIAIQCKGTLAIMGDGSVVANSNAGETGAVSAYGGTVYLYGGTYQGAKANRTSVSSCRGGVLHVYDGVTINSGYLYMGATSSGATSSAYIHGGTFKYAFKLGDSTSTIKIYGGTFSAQDPTAYLANTTCYSADTTAPYTVTASHTWSAGVEDPIHNCTTDGVMTYTCTVDGCGATKTETVAATGHNFGENDADEFCSVCGEANPNYEEAITADCPHCDEEVVWVPFKDGNTPAETTHYYLKEKVVSTGTATLQTYGDAILYLNGQDLEFSGRIRARGGCDLYIFGEGNLTRIDSDSENTMMESSSSGNIYISGGNFTNNDPNVAMFAGTGYVITGGTFNEDPSAYTSYECISKDDTAGTWTVEAENHTFDENAPTCSVCGEANPDYVALPEKCPGCGETVTEWVPFTGGNTHGGTSSTEKIHYYLAANLDSTAGNVMQTYGPTCLYLNGKDMIFDGRFRVRTGGSLDICGTGNVTRRDSASTYSMFEVKQSAYATIHGGTYKNLDTLAWHDGEKLIIKGGTFYFDPSEYAAYECISHNETAGTWTVEAENHNFGDNNANEFCSVCGAGNPHYVPETCPCCGETVTDWIPVTEAANDTGWKSNMSGHYYLANDITDDGKRVFKFPAGTDVCLYLNGYDVTGESTENGTAVFYTNGTLRIGGKGTVSTPNVVVPEGKTPSYGTVASVGEGALVQIYGGTYIDSASRNQAVRATGEMTVYGGTFSSENVSSFVDDTKWALPKGGNWEVMDMTDAAVLTADGYEMTGTFADALASCDTNEYILIGSATDIELTKPAYVDLNGKTVNVTGTGMLYAMDSAGNGAWNVEDDEYVVRDVVNPVTNVRYLTVKNETCNNTYEFDMKISKVVLRAGTTYKDLGIYYRTNITVGADLAELIDSYGVALSLGDMPVAGDIGALNTDVLYTMIDNNAATGKKLTAGTQTINSGLLNNILNEDNDPDVNTQHGAWEVFANAYIALDLDGDGYEEYIMADNDENDGNNVKRSLMSIMTEIDAMETPPQLAIDCYKYWAPMGMNTWGLTKLDAAAFPVEE